MRVRYASTSRTKHPQLAVGVDGSIPPGPTVDESERWDLHKALERVLPPVGRAIAKDTRNSRMEQEILADPYRLHDNERVGVVFDFMVAGATFNGRGDVIDAHLRGRDFAFLCRDRMNSHSRNATEVPLANGMMVGYVPETLARQIALLLDQGHLYVACFKKVLLGQRAPIPVVIGELLPLDTKVTAARAEGVLPSGVTPVPEAQEDLAQAQVASGQQEEGMPAGFIAALFLLGVAGLTAIVPILTRAR